MFIAKFNKLIRNKFVWSSFAFIVILSFVVWQTNVGGIAEEEARNAAGKLDGKPVPAEERQSAYFNSYLSMSLMLGRPLKMTARIDKALNFMAWRRLIALRGAGEAQLAVSPEEIVGAIQHQPFFQEGGQFSPARYAAFIQQFLANLRATEQQFEDYIRQEILLNKARLMISKATWVAPMEIEQVYHQLYDTFVASYVKLDANELGHTAKLSETQAKAYFEAHTNDFIIPLTMRVKYAVFPFERFLDEGAVEEEEVRDYYDEHIEEFTTRGTGDLFSARSFDEMEDTLRERLALNAAIESAGDLAADFEVTLAPDRNGQGPVFETAAAAAGVMVSTSSFFAVNERIAGLRVGLDFNKAAFALRPTPEDYFSYPVMGSNAFYVLAFEDRAEPRLPDYNEVRARVQRAALAQASSDKLEEIAVDIHKALSEAVGRGQTFQQALRPYHLEVITTEPFEIHAGLDMEDSDAFYELTKNIMFLNPGELTGPIPVKNGIIIGYIDARMPANPALLESIKPELGKYILNRREDLSFRDWQEYLLKIHKFEDLAARRQADDEETEDSGADAPGADDVHGNEPGG